jgi:hypothetical protein
MDPQSQSVSMLSRRRFMQAAAAAAAGATASLASPSASTASADHHGDGEVVVPPAPIPGGIDLGGGQVIQVWAPGDPGVTLPFTGSTLMGFDVEPATITDFKGFSAAAFHAGTARGSDGATYDVETDLRAFKGTYVDSTGTRRFGAFAFI